MNRKRVLKIVGDITFYVILIFSVLGAFLFASNDDPNKSIFGYRIYDVKTGSMEPVYSVGSMVIVKLKSAEDISVGDDITFYRPGNDIDVWTHRVTQIIEDYNGQGIAFKTQGIANKSEDPFITLGGNVVGTVIFSVPWIGYILLFAQKNMFLTVIILVSTITLIQCIIVIIKPESKKPRYGEKSEKNETFVDK